jgi:predicted metal-dependent HD superfamily phosphohydrolase
LTIIAPIRSDRAVMNALRMRYGEAHRRYHVWAHIETLFKLMEWRQADLYNREAIEIAILFHDAIYEPGEEDNEKRSAGLMQGMLSKTVAPVTLQAAHAMILATEKHVLADDMVDPLRSDCAYFLDMDLAVLGSAPEVFEAFDLAIREEFAEFSDEDYREGRRAALESFLKRKTIYLTQPFHDAFEAQARINLEQAVGALTD